MKEVARNSWLGCMGQSNEMRVSLRETAITPVPLLPTVQQLIFVAQTVNLSVSNSVSAQLTYSTVNLSSSNSLSAQLQFVGL